VKFREQSLISKMGGVEGDLYVLSSLGEAIGKHWEKTQLLTQQNLNIYTSQLRLLLDELLVHARSGGSDDFWTDRITLPLREIVAEIINCIRHRQEGMKRVQSEIEKEIVEKLRSGWIEAIDACEGMLQKTGATISELHTLLLQEADSLLSALDELASLAQSARQRECMDAIDSVQSQIETIRQWANISLEEWSQYYNHVHDFIRVTVRADPNREVTYRLRDAIQIFFNILWTFPVRQSQPLLQLREGPFSPPTSPVEITGMISHAVIDDSQETDNSLLEAVAKEIEESLAATGKASLVSILMKRIPEMDLPKIYCIAGDMVRMMAERGCPSPFVNVSWTNVMDNIQMQDLTVLGHQPD
jgi:chromosome partition protein MukF